MHPALEPIREATRGSRFEGRIWLVGGAVRDVLAGGSPGSDLDLVVEGPALELAALLRCESVSSIEPVTYPRFGTALVRVLGAQVELVTARAESYGEASRKPNVRPASLEEDAKRRDFTVNTLLYNVHTGEIRDPLGVAAEDLEARILRTPLDPEATFSEDPLRMLRAVRFRHQLGFEPAERLFDAVRAQAARLDIVSRERIRDEWLKMLALPNGADAMSDLMDTGLFDHFLPEMSRMVGVEQGNFHHLDVWDHTLLVLRNVGHADPLLALAALFHDVGKPATRMRDDQGRTRFFGHEAVGADITQEALTRMKLASREVEAVTLLVKNHMRLGSSPELSPAAARRVVRDLGAQVQRLLDLVEADTKALKPGVQTLDIASIRNAIELTLKKTPVGSLESPLTGEEIMEITHLPPGRKLGQVKRKMVELVLDGVIAPGDADAARAWLDANARRFDDLK